jgi:hypothetical protein
MSEDRVFVKEHKGFRIDLSQRVWRFYIDSDDFGGENWHNSLVEATKAIDDQIGKEAKLKLEDMKFEEAGLDNKGNPITIIGIHRATRHVRTKGGEVEGHVYPAVPWVGSALKRLQELYDVDAMRCDDGHHTPPQQRREAVGVLPT